MFVKDCEGSEIFSTLKLLACQNSIDAGRRHVTSESETKDFITHNKASNISFMFASGTLAHGGNAEHPGGHVTTKEPQAKGAQVFYSGLRKTCLTFALQGNYLYYTGQ